MTGQPRWLAVLLCTVVAAGCSLNAAHDSSRARAISNSYVVHGQRYYVLHNTDGFVQRGIASWYGRKFHGRRTSSGEIYDMYAMTAAHKRLPIPSQVEVINLTNGRRAVVRINDRGPFVDNRIIDVSYAAAKQLGMLGSGTALVEIRAISHEPVVAGRALASAAPEAAAEAAAVPVGATRAEPSAEFYVQAGAFTDLRNAYRLQGRLEAAEFAAPVRVELFDQGGSKYYRVRLGPLPSRAAAGELARRLASYGIDDARMIDTN
ncbi:MAG: septal ring lytic transglycosylase RlpA family protein [Nitrococcus sp.]|nr:septal ring lytic transglycosylase RlpA family protein [Nitrococcus sp.]